MVLRLTDAHGIKPGQIFLVETEPYKALSNDISKTGKHGASKCRIVAIGVFNGKKKIIAVPGGERFDVPNVEKKRVQVLSVGERVASVMDLDSYETIDVTYDEELKGQLQPEQQAEIWDIEGKKVIMRIL
jgi:translation initiation factor 5A